MHMAMRRDGGGQGGKSYEVGASGDHALANLHALGDLHDRAGARPERHRSPLERLAAGLHEHDRSARVVDDLVEGLQFLARSTRLEPGCIECNIWADPDALVHYTEDWQTEADIRRRVPSDQFTSLLTVVEAAQDVHAQFDFVAETRGLDYVMEVRAQAERGPHRGV